MNKEKNENLTEDKDLESYVREKTQHEGKVKTEKRKKEKRKTGMEKK